VERPEKRNQNYGWHDNRAVWHVRHFAPLISEFLTQNRCHKILDLGCGNGAFAARLAAECFSVTGVDPDQQGVAIAREHAKGEFFVASCYDDPLQLGLTGFDAVTCLAVVEDLYWPDAGIQFARKALKDSGWLIVSTPYHGYLKNLCISLLGRWDQHCNPLRREGISSFSRARR
jgi:2-polyprenyl-3-methyl-5-hydroxy-6-metoxy-1,4-benzoquinol methylase